MEFVLFRRLVDIYHIFLMGCDKIAHVLLVHDNATLLLLNEIYISISLNTINITFNLHIFNGNMLTMLMIIEIY